MNWSLMGISAGPWPYAFYPGDTVHLTASVFSDYYRIDCDIDVSCPPILHPWDLEKYVPGYLKAGIQTNLF